MSRTVEPLWSGTISEVDLGKTYSHAASPAEHNKPIPSNYEKPVLGLSEIAKIQKLKRVEELRLESSYNDAVSRGMTSIVALLEIKSIWNKIKANVPGILLPPYLTISEGYPMLYWRNENYYASIELSDGRIAEYYTSVTSSFDSELLEIDSRQMPPDVFLKFLYRFRLID